MLCGKLFAQKRADFFKGFRKFLDSPLQLLLADFLILRGLSELYVRSQAIVIGQKIFVVFFWKNFKAFGNKEDPGRGAEKNVIRCFFIFHKQQLAQRIAYISVFVFFADCAGVINSQEGLRLFKAEHISDHLKLQAVRLKIKIPGKNQRNLQNFLIQKPLEIVNQLKDPRLLSQMMQVDIDSPKIGAGKFRMGNPGCPEALVDVKSAVKVIIKIPVVGEKMNFLFMDISPCYSEQAAFFLLFFWLRRENIVKNSAHSHGLGDFFHIFVDALIPDLLKEIDIAAFPFYKLKD